MISFFLESVEVFPSPPPRKTFSVKTLCEDAGFQFYNNSIQ